jgi:uncharacterized membrane protein
MNIRETTALNFILKKKWITTAIVLIISLIVLFVLFTKALPMLIVTKANYTDYYWHRAGWLFGHVITGILTTLLGPFQFIQSLRNRHIKFHKALGKIYIVCVLISSITANYLAFTTPLNLIYSVGLSVGGIFWISTTGMALLAIKKRNILQHNEWMTRSYIISLFFILYLFIKDVSVGLGLARLMSSMSDVSALLVWVSWSIPLFITEIILQGRKLYKVQR